MRLLLLILLLTITERNFCQSNSINPFDAQKSNDIYALVVGISNYQDPSIPDLNYADSDALAFASFLEQNYKDTDNNLKLKVLLNEKATLAQFAISLDWLIQNVKENNSVIIYFSGHGDVERKTISQPGFLLCWDAPSRVYMAGGALSLSMLQEILTTLSTQNKGKVVLIADACRSGKLSGSEIGGPQATTASLAKQYNNEIKILSCQPDEFSVEGPQWGGGRGAFSYHLLNGLYGMADENEDSLISLKEIDNYIENYVSKEVAPLKQNPFTIGNKTLIVSKVNSKTKSSFEDKNESNPLFLATNLKGLEDLVLEKVSPRLRSTYLQFKKTLDTGYFFEPIDNCADTFFNLLINESQLDMLHDGIQRMYAAALQDDAQQVINKILKTNPDELGLSKSNKLNKYKNFPKYLARAADLLGSKHYMYGDLMSRKCFFEAYLLHLDNQNYNKLLGKKCLDKYDEALYWKHDLPHVYYGKMLVNFYQLMQPDSAEYYAKKATEQSPKWFLPYSVLAYMYSHKGSLRNLDRVKYYLNLADTIDSDAATTNIWHIKNWANYYTNTAMFSESEEKLKEIILIDSSLAWPHIHLGNNYQSTYRMYEAEREFKLAVKLDSTSNLALQKLGEIYHFTNRFNEAEAKFKEAIKLDSLDINSYIGLISTNIVKENYIEVEKYFNIVTQIDSISVIPYYKTASAYYRNEKFDEAIKILKKGINKDSTVLDFYIALAATYLEKRDYTNAEYYYKYSITLDTNNIFTNMGLGHLYKMTDRYNQATAQYNKVLTIDSNFIEAYHSLGQIAIKQNDDYKTEYYLRKALTLDSLHERANQKLGKLYIKLGKYNQAENFLKKGLKKGSPNLKYVYIDLVVLYCLQNNNELAFKHLENALKLGYNINDEYINLITDTQISVIRENTKRWNFLINKYSP